MYEINQKTINLDVETLNYVVSEWCYAHGEYELIAAWFRKYRYTSKYYDNREKYEKEYDQKSRADSAAWSQLYAVSKVVGLDPRAVVAVFKSIRRNAQYQHGWNHEAQFNYNRFFEWEDKRPGSVESFCDLCRASR